jgi:hypothetical protein
MIEKISSVEQERRLDHGAMDLLIIQSGELVPFRQDGDGMCAVGSRIRIGLKNDLACQLAEVQAGILDGLWVADNNLGMFPQ